MFTLTLSVTGALIISILYQFYHNERKELRDLAQSIDQVLEYNDKNHDWAGSDKSVRSPKTAGSHGELIDRDKELAESIDNKLSLLFDEDDFNLSYAIFTKDGDLEHKYHYTLSNSFEDIATHSRSFFVRFKTYKNWIFCHWKKGNFYDVVVSSNHNLEIIDKLLISLLLILPVGILLTFVLSRSLSEKVLVPLQNIVSTTRQIEQGNLKARIPLYASGDEVEHLIDRLNSTFSQLEFSLNQTRRFIADAAHELRTPIAAIHGHLEVGLRSDQSVAEFQKTIQSVLEEVKVLGKVVDQLILLERTKSNYFENKFRIVNFSEILAHQALDLGSVGREKHISLDADITPEITVEGIDTLLVQLCYNLIGNAIKFSPNDSTVKIELERDQQWAMLHIRDKRNWDRAGRSK